MRVWGVLLIYGVQKQTHRLLPWEVVVAVLLVLLVGGTEKPIFLVSVQRAMAAAVAEVHGPIVEEPIQLLEITIVVVLVTDADFDA